MIKVDTYLNRAPLSYGWQQSFRLIAVRGRRAVVNVRPRPSGKMNLLGTSTTIARFIFTNKILYRL